LNGNSAYRLLLYLKEGVGSIPTVEGDDYNEMPPGIQEEMQYRYREPQDTSSRGMI